LSAVNSIDNTKPANAFVIYETGISVPKIALTNRGRLSLGVTAIGSDSFASAQAIDLNGVDGSASFAGGAASVAAVGSFVSNRTDKEDGNAFSAAYNDNITAIIKANGSASFFGGIKTQKGIYRDGGPNCGIIFYSTATGSTVSPCDGAGTGRSNSVNLGDPSNTWKAVYAGNVRTSNVELQTEADDDTKYTSTTDSEGVETRVYNGATLDVKDRLQKADAALQTLKTAAAASTDFASLKSAIATALANI